MQEKLSITGINSSRKVSGEFLTIAGERYYAIRNVDALAPFFISVVSNSDHWLFLSSTGGLTAGRVSPQNALFPYITDDKIHESTTHTGSKTVLRVSVSNETALWEPFNVEQDGQFSVSRHIYKNLAGNKVCFEEINHELQLAYRYWWLTSDDFGFIRRCELHNLANQEVAIEILDGLQNILPANVPLPTQTNSSNLVDAYKWNELVGDSGLAIYTLYSRISDRAEPAESLRANVVFCLGLSQPLVSLTSAEVRNFRAGQPIHAESPQRGVRGAYFINAALDLAPDEVRSWQFVANVALGQAQIVRLQQLLSEPAQLATAVEKSIQQGDAELARIMANTDALQSTGEEMVMAHHYANVLFNNLRGGIFDDQYNVMPWDFSCTLATFNRQVHERHRHMLEQLPDSLPVSELLEAVRKQQDPQLERLCCEYLPIRFGRRHGDPSRPWNQFAIRLKDDEGHRLLSYEGNWRDIFQNWEALTFSYPDFIESVIAKFLNASTMDGYNPYRITKEGIDWEVEDPKDPWSYIGYWGDHQIIYLLKLLELSLRFHPERLAGLLDKPLFSYANVPYRIKPFADLWHDPKHTVDFDHDAAATIRKRVERMGADGKLVLDTTGDVLQVTMTEKLLVPFLAKLSNFVVDGGIWLNTQRPEWNDANNALVGNGLSMVTLYYLRRYVRFLRDLLADKSGSSTMSAEVATWLQETADALHKLSRTLGDEPVEASKRFAILYELGSAADRYRESIYREASLSVSQDITFDAIRSLLDDALTAFEHSIATNQRQDGLFHAYNLLVRNEQSAEIEHLYLMLEGQVAALSSGAVSADAACDLLEKLFDSDIYCSDRKSFMLYPDRPLPGFLEKNRFATAAIENIPLVQRMLQAGDESLILRDADDVYRFNADFANAEDLNRRLDSLTGQYGDEVAVARAPLLELYEKVFNHRAFTGRSGGMFGFEGLGCIYWHMVSKLMLAVQERFFAEALSNGRGPGTARLASYYYRIREGLGFNKTPAEYGAFPADPYSHTPRHKGARQPGMTGQVKEEVLCRFGELGLQVERGEVKFMPYLLRASEFVPEAHTFKFLDVAGQWRSIDIKTGSLAFTWCQVPIVYMLGSQDETAITITRDSGDIENFSGNKLPAEQSAWLFSRNGKIQRIEVSIPQNVLSTDQDK